MESTEQRPAWKTLLAFAIIYFVWGTTFLAIRVGVLQIPPFLFAGARFLTAGVILYAWLALHGEPSPTKRQWLSVFLLALFIFVLDYGLLFWAEQRVPSGIAAVLVATIPLFTGLSEILLLRTQRLTPRLTLALFSGIAGVAVLMNRSLWLAGVPVDRKGAIALLFASVSWSIASVVSRKVPLPRSKIMISAAQMLAGGILLLCAAAALGEFRTFRVSNIERSGWFSLAYLIVAGSLIAYTAYIWLLHHESPTKVATYAYVNPIVAVLTGYYLGGEAIDQRTLLGSLFILVSVVLLTLRRTASPLPAVQEHDAA